jgi:hypothetical protein
MPTDPALLPRPEAQIDGTPQTLTLETASRTRYIFRYSQTLRSEAPAKCKCASGRFQTCAGTWSNPHGPKPGRILSPPSDSSKVRKIQQLQELGENRGVRYVLVWEGPLRSDSHELVTRWLLGETQSKSSDTELPLSRARHTALYPLAQLDLR